MARRRLTDRALKSLEPASPGRRYDIMDSDVPGLGIRVTDKGQRTFVLLTRYPGSPNPTRRALGEYGVLSLEQARQKARQWHDLIRKGIDPKTEEERQRQVEQTRRDNSFEAIAEDFIRIALIGPDSTRPKQRTGVDTAREIRAEFISRYGSRPIDSITARDIIEVTDAAIERGAPYHAHHLLAHVRRMFNWAIARGIYGIERSPCDRMKPSQVIGAKALRTRVLSDDELRALWSAAESMGYPFGPLIKMLLLTGQRRSEVGECTWPEIDLQRRIWDVPAERMKAKAAHVLPLTSQVASILEQLPRYSEGRFLFSTTFGRVPVSGYSKAKTRLDSLMLANLDEQSLSPWVFHDI
ncbi:MAG: site-specific integrase, partial [Hyphomicrobiales bacterium]|nr:site-specific integrase [Hyphomicrobiales bacterium]